MNKILTILFILCLTLSGCNRIWKDVVHSTSPETFVSSFKSYRGEYKKLNLKGISIQLPKDFVVHTDSFDGFEHVIYASSHKDLYLLHIYAIPFEVKPETAIDFLRPLTNLRSINFQPDSFVEGKTRGIYEEVNDGEDGVFDGESFCFTKKGFTFYILSYGRKSDYYSSFEIVKRIEPITEPITKKEQKEIAERMKPEFEEASKELIHSKIIQDPILQGYFDCQKVEVDLSAMNIRCTLTGDYSQLYPGQKSILHSILIDTRCIKPYNSYYALLGYNFSIGFYKTFGEQIDLNN